jgi:dihydroneopterin aldolase
LSYSRIGTACDTLLSHERKEESRCQINPHIDTGEKLDSHCGFTPIKCDVYSKRLTVETKEFPLKIGCYPEEQTRTTLVKMILELQLPDDYCIITDDLSSTIDYDELVSYLEQSVLHQRFQLLEYACKEIYLAIQRFLKMREKHANVRITLIKQLSHKLLKHSSFIYGDF